MKSWLFPLWVIIDVLILLAAVSMWITAPEFLTLNLALTVFAFALGIVLIFLRLDSLLVFMKSSYFKKVLFHSINVGLVLSILALLNYLGNKNYKEFDLTSTDRNSLTEQSRKVLEMVNSPMKMTVFSRREEWSGIINLLKLFRSQNRNIEIEAVDTDLRPDLVKMKEIASNGTVLINYEGKESQFQIMDELSVTNALLKILREDDIVLYFVTGH